MPSTSPGSPASFLSADGEMAARIRAFDWQRTPLGPPDTWRPTLKAMVRMALTTRHPIFIFWGPELICLYNDGYRPSLGDEKHPAILGMPAAQAWPEIWSIIRPQIALVLRGDGATWNENQLVPIERHGHIEDVYWTYSYGPIDDEDAPNGVGGVLVICTETTEQVLSARRIEAERAGFLQLFEQAPTFMAVLRGADHRVELANPRYVRLLGHRPLIGRTILEAVPEAAGQGYIELLDEVYRSGNAYTAIGSRLQLQAVPGGPVEEVLLDFVYQPMKDDTGTVTGIFVEGVDVSERREAEQALRDSEERFRLAVQSSSLGTWDVDLADGVIALSQRALDQFDLDASGVGFDDVMAAVHPGDRERVATAIAHARDANSSGEYRIRHRVQRRDGEVRWLNATGRVTRIARADGRVQERFVGVLADITEQQQLLDMLREADRRKDEFLATLAHELRNPLAPIRTAAHMLAMPNLSAERLAWCSDMIKRQTATMALLLDDLLEVSRISSGRLELRWGPADVRAMVKTAVETAQPVVDAKRHALEVVFTEPLPEIHADALRVSQILTNLLTNAAKYTDPQGHLRIEVRAVADRVQFDVVDDGIGLAHDMLHAVFEMFHQVKDARDRTQGGLGIGLSLSQGLAALHGGRVEAFSDGAGKGSTFRLTLPLNIDTATPELDDER